MRARPSSSRHSLAAVPTVLTQQTPNPHHTHHLLSTNLISYQLLLHRSHAWSLHRTDTTPQISTRGRSKRAWSNNASAKQRITLRENTSLPATLT